MSQIAALFEPCKSPAPWFSPFLLHDLKCDTEPFVIPKGLEYHRSLAGSTFESSDSESDCSSDSGDDASSTESKDMSLSVYDPTFSSNEYFLYCGDIDILPIVKSNALGLELGSEPDILDNREFLTAHPQAGSLRPSYHHLDDHSYEISCQKHYAWQEHLAHQPKSQAEETLASEHPQNFCLRANTSNTSGREALQLNITMSRQKAHPYPGYCGPLCTDDDAVKWLGIYDQGQGSAADAFSTCVVNAQAHDSELQWAPRMRLISLPPEEDEEQTMTLDYLEPEFPLPIPFSTVN